MPHIVEGALKDYAWGVVDGLAPWHGPTGAPQAELWFGTHPAGPTRVIEGPDAGAMLAELEGHRGMPLVKLLAAATPLSIQVHPDAHQAERGWASGSDLYADGGEKAEMLVALAPFDIHVGWRDAAEAAAALAEAGAAPAIIERVRSGDAQAAARLILQGDDRSIADRIVGGAHRAGWPQADVDALATVAAAFPGDPGITLTALMHHDVLAPGEAIAVAPGIVHSYLCGLGVEVMTTSDNVLRLGLTTKPVAVDEALQAVRTDRHPQRLAGAAGEVLAPSDMPFDLMLAAQDHTVLGSERHRVVLALEGDVHIASGPGAGQRVAQGRAAVWAPGEAEVVIEADGRAVLVTGAATPTGEGLDQLPG